MPDAARATAPRPAHRGLHRRAPDTRSRVRRGVDLLARLGAMVSLAALLVLGVAVAGAVDGAADGVGSAGRGTPTVTVTIVSR